MSYSPRGTVDSATAPVAITFDKPVVAPAQVGKPADPRTVTITPAIAWKGFWRDRQTLVIDATDPLAPSTRYTVSLAGELATRTDAFQMSFVHEPLDLTRSWLDNVGPTADLEIPFNQPVRPEDVIAHCALVSSSQGSIPLALPANATPVPRATVTVHPTQPLVAGETYQLGCALLGGDGGNTTADKLALSMHVRDGLKVTFDLARGSDGVQPDHAHIKIEMTNPVRLDDIRAAIHASPAIPNLDQGYAGYNGTSYEVYVDLEAQTDYTLSVDGTLGDLSGDKLGSAATETFHTANARGRLAMDRGIVAVEAAKPYSVWSRNLSKLSIACAPVSRDALLALLTDDSQLDPWGYYARDTKPFDWAKLGLSPKRVDQTFDKHNTWNRDELDLGATCIGKSAAGRRGLYMTDVTSDDLHEDPDRPWQRVDRNRLLANVTDLGVMIESGQSSGLIWVTSLASGQPVSGARVTIYDPRTKKQVWAGASDGSGIVRTPGTQQLLPVIKQATAEDPERDWEWREYGAQRLIAIVESKDDLAVVDGNWSGDLQMWNFNLRQDAYGAAGGHVRGFIESDRGLYRPGEQVHFKGIVRQLTAQGPRPPARRPVHVEVVDSRGTSVMTTDTQLSAFGGFAFDLGLASDAWLGDYIVTATAAGERFTERFTVQEFRPAAFELGLTAKDPRPESLAFSLDAKYLFGSPLPDAKVDWNISKRPHHVEFPGYEEFSFSPDPHAYWWSYRGYGYGEFLGNGQGTTDSQGHLDIDQPDGNRGDGPIDYVVSAAVTDAANQTIDKSAVITSHQTSLYLGVHSNEYVVEAGTPFPIELVAVKPDGTRTNAKVHMQLVHTTWECVWQDRGYRTYSQCDSKDNIVNETDVELANAGAATQKLMATGPGDYIVRVTTKDDAGREVAAATEIYMYGKGNTWWGADDTERMTVVASKPSYEIGDVAHLMPMASLESPTALIEIERDGILDARVVKLDSAGEGVTVPIKDAWAPNVFASVTMVSGRHGPADKDRPQLKMGKVELRVSSKAKELQVAVELDKDKVKPGERVSGKLRVTSAGAPVRAEIALSAADEGVLQLIDYQTPNPMAKFYAAYGLGVEAATNFSKLARALDPDGNDADQGGDTASRLNAGKVRSKFVASAFWAPMLVTDEHGEASFSFIAPDNLGAFRLMAAVADTGDRFGAAERRLTVAKPVMAVPALPRFLEQGDRAQVGVIVHNTTETAGTAVITATATGGATLDGATAQTIALPAHGEVAVRFPASVSADPAAAATSATFGFGVVMGTEKDAVEVQLPIVKPHLETARALVDGTVDNGWSGTLGIGSDVLRNDSKLAISVDRTGVGQLGPSLDSLIEYPYGCLEQTMSRFVPLLAAKDIGTALGNKAFEGGQAEQFIQAGVAKVIRHQQQDGMFSLWPSSQTYPHLTAYAMWGLTVAEQQGHEKVPAEVFDRGIKAITDWANDPKSLQPGSSGGTMAMAAYVMALRGKPNAGLAARLYAAREGLPMWGKAFLLRAMTLAHADRAQVATLEKLITDDVKLEGATAHVKEAADSGDDFELSWATDARAQALVLSALLESDPKSPLVDALASGLLSQRGPSGAWESTQDNVWSLVSLAQYARRSGKGELDTSIKVAGKTIATKHLSGAMVETLTLPLAQVTGDDVAVSVTGTAHVSVRVIEARIDRGAAESHGYSVTRAYTDTTGKALATVKAGQLVNITLSIHADDTHRWIAISDPLPAGFEAVNPDLATGNSAAAANDTAGGGGGDYYDSRWGTYGRWSYTEMRDDRVRWFADQFYQGAQEITYQARATTPGTFTAAPTTIEAMYQPEINGRSDTQTITVDGK
jgi:hypothetical protein|nr:MG2 domain-containing protein [Kofleriaceae bacterium]